MIRAWATCSRHGCSSAIAVLDLYTSNNTSADLPPGERELGSIRVLFNRLFVRQRSALRRQTSIHLDISRKLVSSLVSL